MLRRKKDVEIEYLKERVKELDERYWELRRAHNRLLDHFGLNDNKILEHHVIVKKGGPEKG